MKTVVEVAVKLALTVALMATLATGAWSGERTVKIHSVDLADRVLLLDDGTKLWLAEGLSIEGLKEGARIKLSYEERDGRSVITGFEVE